MAAFRIHEDQENLNREFHHKPVTSMDAVQNRRAVLGVLDNKPERLALGKQPLGNTNIKFGDENAYNKQASSKLPPPVVPVAQFQAFTVYEDTIDEKIENQLRERQRKNRHKDEFSNVYKGTSEDRFVTKKEAKAKLQEQGKICPTVFESRPTPVATTPEEQMASPMSVEKSLMDEHDTCSIIAKSKTCRDAFFEMIEYRDEIFTYLKEQEKLHRPKPMYMKKQPDITYSMRTILIDWLVEVTEEYKLHTETLYLAVNYIDRFLSFMSVVRAKLQLVGTAAMFIASKYEEIYPPDVGEFVYITDDTYTKRQVTRMEMLILRILDFDLSIPTTYTFITAICIAHKLQEKVMYLALYLSELSLLEAEPCLETLPSLMAASSIAVARFYSGEEAWTEELVQTTGYSLHDLNRTMIFLNELLEKAPSMAQQAIQEKYKQSKFLYVANVKIRPLVGFGFQ